MKIQSWFDNIKLPIKMSIIALLALIGIAIPTYFYAQLSLGEQSTDEMELAGLSPASEVIVLKKLIAEHRGLSARLFGGDESVAGQISTKGNEIDRQISQLRGDLKVVTNDNALTSIVDDLNNAWKQLQSQVSSRQYNRVSSFAEHSDLLADGDALISNILKQFLLIYERAPGGYHVIVANFENLPRLANALGKVRGSAAGVLAAGNVTEVEVGVIRGFLNTVDTPARDFDYNMHSAFEADDRFSQIRITSADITNKVAELVLLTKQEVLRVGDVSYASNRLFDQFTAVINELYALHEASTDMLREQIKDRVQASTVQRRNAFVAIGILFIISSIIGFIIIRSLSSATKSLITSFKCISEGDFDIDFNLTRKDEMGILESELSVLTQQLRDAAVVAQEASNVKQALDSSSTCFMMLNSEREIVYMNHAVAQLMKNSESDIRKDLPHFNCADLIGTRIDSFHYDPAHQRAMLEQLKTQHKAHLELGGKSFQLNITPITGEDGSDLGNTVEWLDRTTEINAEKEIANMVTASLAGDFSLRINEENKEGFMLTMSKGLNQFVETTESGLNDVSNILLALSEGDLTKRITTEYQGTFNDLKDYCNTTSSNLASVIDSIRQASDTINSAATEIAQGNSDLSTRTEQQASSLEETASSMEQITSTVRLNADNAKQANGLASQATKVAGSGGELIKEVVLTMASIDKSSRKISDIISVIDGIAFQTNILALNAAVEAARAGEQGRGFAVVASEVRTLAQRSANAAKDIKDLISDSVSKVESGNSLVNQSGNTMKEIVVSIQRVNDIMSEIAAASAEQASGIDEVGKAVIQMDEMTQQNAALVEEASAAAESMRAQAFELTERVGTFRLDSGDVRSSGVSIEHKSISNESRYKDPVSKQFDELPSVMSPAESRQASRKVIPTKSDEDEWESF